MSCALVLQKREISTIDDGKEMYKQAIPARAKFCFANVNLLFLDALVAVVFFA